MEGLKSQCLDVASRNLSMWDTGSENGTQVQLPPADIIEASCPGECFDRGDCIEGRNYPVLESGGIMLTFHWVLLIHSVPKLLYVLPFVNKNFECILINCV